MEIPEKIMWNHLPFAEDDCYAKEYSSPDSTYPDIRYDIIKLEDGYLIGIQFPDFFVQEIKSSKEEAIIECEKQRKKFWSQKGDEKK